jgi:glyoxylase-like metal-dependent hydrolase (beta-lactamase superfamily II)
MRAAAALLMAVALLPAVEVVTSTADEHASGTSHHILLGTRSAILVDAPMTRTAFAAWADTVTKALAGRTVTLVYVTDSHPDHTGSLPLVRERFPGVRIIARPEVAADIRTDGAVYHQRLRSRMPDEIHPDLLVPEANAADHLDLDGERLDLIAFDGGHSAHMTAIALPGGRLIACELVYQGHHAYLREQRIAGWKANLDALDRLVTERKITTLIPSHGAACGIDEIARMRAYLDTVERAVALPSRAEAEAAVRAAFPTYRVPKFLTDYTLPAYFPAGKP